MIWKINLVDAAFVAAWLPAGQPDQAVVNRYVNRHGQHPRAARNAGEPRYYYLARENARIRLSTVGLPLEQWQGAAKVLLGTRCHSRRVHP